MQTRKIEGIIEIQAIHEIIEEGVTMPVRCSLSNGMHVIVKYMKNPFGQQVLVNELIGSCIADELGLNIPEYGICNMSEEIIDSTNLNEDIDIRNSGVAFFSKEYTNTVPPVRNVLSLVKSRQTEKLILFDHIVNNCDRHKGNLLLEVGSDAKLYFIDNSHIITEGASTNIDAELEMEYIFSRRVLNSNKDVYDLLATSVGYSPQVMMEEIDYIKECLTYEKLEQYKDIIPQCWLDSVGHDVVNKMFEVIKRRVAAISEIGKMIIEERRK